MATAEDDRDGGGRIERWGVWAAARLGFGDGDWKGGLSGGGGDGGWRSGAVLGIGGAAAAAGAGALGLCAFEGHWSAKWLVLWQ